MQLKILFLSSKTAESMTAIPALASKSQILSLGFATERVVYGVLYIFPLLTPHLF